MTSTNSGIPPEFSAQSEDKSSADFRWSPQANAWRDVAQELPSAKQWDTGRVGILALLLQAYEQIKILIAAQIQLFKLQLKRIGKTASAAAVSFVVALVLLLLVPWWFFHTIELLFALVVPEWVASLITVVIILALAVLFIYLGVKKARRVAGEAQQVSSQFQDKADAVKEGINSD